MLKISRTDSGFLAMCQGRFEIMASWQCVLNISPGRFYPQGRFKIMASRQCALNISPGRFIPSSGIFRKSSPQGLQKIMAFIKPPQEFQSIVSGIPKNRGFCEELPRDFKKIMAFVQGSKGGFNWATEPRDSFSINRPKCMFESFNKEKWLVLCYDNLSQIPSFQF